MSAAAGNTIPFLAITEPLQDGAIVYTSKVIAGQYTSITISVATDVDANINVQLSNDGVFWDININFTTIAGVHVFEPIPIVAKWIRLLVTNLTIGTNATYTRILSYGTPQNTSVNAILTTLDNLDPAVRVTNLPGNQDFGVISATSYESLFTIRYWPMVGELETPDSLIWPNSSGSITTINHNSPAFPGLAVSFSAGRGGTVITFNSAQPGASDNTCNVSMASSLYPVTPNTGVIYQQSISLDLPTYDPPSSQTRVNLSVLFGFGVRDNEIGSPIDFLGFGYPRGSTRQDILSILYVRDAQLIFSIPSNLWNIDRADGTQAIPLPINYTAMNTYQIVMQDSSDGQVFFRILDPTTGTFQLVHIIRKSAVAPAVVENGCFFNFPSAVSAINLFHRTGGLDNDASRSTVTLVLGAAEIKRDTSPSFARPVYGLEIRRTIQNQISQNEYHVVWAVRCKDFYEGFNVGQSSDQIFCTHPNMNTLDIVSGFLNESSSGSDILFLSILLAKWDSDVIDGGGTGPWVEYLDGFRLPMQVFLPDFLDDPIIQKTQPLIRLAFSAVLTDLHTADLASIMGGDSRHDTHIPPGVAVYFCVSGVSGVGAAMQGSLNIKIT